DPFAESGENEVGSNKVQEGLIHIRIQQRNGRKTLTTVQGIHPKYDLKKIVKACKKQYACNGTVSINPEYGECIQLQGDQREKIKEFMMQVGLARPEQIKVGLNTIIYWHRSLINF
ncbi:hypothetical protein LOTGIDRAFT_145923, partial [Lottia gigantea]